MSKLVIAAIVVALAAAGALWFSAQPRGTDEEQIRETLSQAQAAIEAKSIGAVRSHISDDYEGAGGNKDQVTALLVNAFRNSESVRVVLDAPAISIRGDSAEVDTKARLSASSTTGDGSEVTYDTDAHFELRKEQVKRYLVVPVRAWRVAGANFKMGAADLF